MMKKLNAIFWIVAALAMMIYSALSWENYDFSKFIASLCIHGGISYIFWLAIDEYID